MAELSRWTNGIGTSLKGMHCNLLFDEVQPFDKGIHSTGVLALQICDVEARNRGKSYTVGILAVIPGP